MNTKDDFAFVISIFDYWDTLVYCLIHCVESTVSGKKQFFRFFCPENTGSIPAVIYTQRTDRQIDN